VPDKGRKRKGDKEPPQPRGGRHPATPKEERAVEEEELESFRRRKQWADEVLGQPPETDRGDEKHDEPPDG
jgi:hypothetical protein